MVARKSNLDDAFGLDVDPATRAVILIEERLRNIEARSEDRSEAVARIEAAMDNQQIQINQVVTDMAVLKSQHASFWKVATFIFGALSFVSGAIGWVASHLTK
jgi:hypothetical protein